MNKLSPPPAYSSAMPDLKKKQQFQKWLSRIGKAESWKRWTGIFDVIEGEATGASFHIETDLSILARQIGGQGTTLDLPSDTPSLLTITGNISTSDISLHLWIDHHELASEPFDCIGTINQSRTSIAGTWKAGCFFSASCNCDGHAGTFILTRIS